MDSFIGYSLREALDQLEEKNKIINIIKVIGRNKRFINNLDRPYVIREDYSEDEITLYISYY